MKLLFKKVVPTLKLRHRIQIRFVRSERGNGRKKMYIKMFCIDITLRMKGHKAGCPQICVEVIFASFENIDIRNESDMLDHFLKTIKNIPCALFHIIYLDGFFLLVLFLNVITRI